MATDTVFDIPTRTMSELVERIASLICASPVDIGDSLRVWQRYMPEEEKPSWRRDAETIARALEAEGFVHVQQNRSE